MNDRDEMTGDLLEELDGFDFDTDETDETDEIEPDDEDLPAWGDLATAGPDDPTAPEIIEADRRAAVAWVRGEHEGTVAERDVLGDHVAARKIGLRRLIEQCATSGCLDFEGVRSRADLLAHVAGCHLDPPLPAWIPTALGLAGTAYAAAAAGESHGQELRPDAGAIVAPVRHLTWLHQRFGEERFTSSAVLAAAGADPEGCGLRPGLVAQQLGRNYRRLARGDAGLRVYAVGYKHGGARLWRLSRVYL